MKSFPNPLDITQFRNTNDFLQHAVCYEEQACHLLKFSMSQEVKKRNSTALIIEMSQLFLKVFPETNVVLFTYLKR